MEKRGISPLIASVLIIGFVIVLGSMVMIWGTDIFKKYQSESGEKAITQLTCTTKINLNIKEACDLGTSVRVKLENLADQNINSLIYRIMSPSGAAIDVIDEALAPFEVKNFYPPYFAVDQFYTKPNKIEILPIVLIDGKEQTCPGTSKEIKPCYTLPSLNDLDDWEFSGGSSGLIKDNTKILSLLESKGIKDVIGVYVDGSDDLIITSTKEFVIPPDADSFFIRVLTQGTGSVTYGLVIDGTEYTDSEEVYSEQAEGATIIGRRFSLTNQGNAQIKVTKTGGGSVAITNIAYELQ